MATTSVFVEQAAAAVAQETVHPGEERANQLLQDARRHIYYWPQFFQGFEARLRYVVDGALREGRFHASESRRIEVEWMESFDHRWTRFQLEELISHREAPDRSKLASKNGCEWGNLDPVYGQKVVFIADKMGSFYRLKDKKITQIGRSYGNTSFIINIDSHHNFGTPGRPRYAAGDYVAFYWSKETGELTKTETYRDSYVRVDGIALPLERRVSIAQAGSSDGGLSVRQLRFENHQLLSSATHT